VTEGEAVRNMGELGRDIDDRSPQPRSTFADQVFEEKLILIPATIPAREARVREDVITAAPAWKHLRISCIDLTQIRGRCPAVERSVGRSGRESIGKRMFTLRTRAMAQNCQSERKAIHLFSMSRIIGRTAWPPGPMTMESAAP
jgi:hypothetical protein